MSPLILVLLLGAGQTTSEQAASARLLLLATDGAPRAQAPIRVRFPPCCFSGREPPSPRMCRHCDRGRCIAHRTGGGWRGVAHGAQHIITRGVGNERRTFLSFSRIFFATPGGQDAARTFGQDAARTFGAAVLPRCATHGQTWPGSRTRWANLAGAKAWIDI